jgi:hypothetical protein
MIVDFKQLAPDDCELESFNILKFGSCEKAVQLDNRTSVVLLGCQLMSEIKNAPNRGLPPAVKMKSLPVVFPTSLGRGPSFLILGRIIAKLQIWEINKLV